MSSTKPFPDTNVVPVRSLLEAPVPTRPSPDSSESGSTASSDSEADGRSRANSTTVVPLLRRYQRPVDDDGSKSSSDVDVAVVGASLAGAENDYPEGGIRAWLVVLGCWLALFASTGLMNMLAICQPYLGNVNKQAAYQGGIIGGIFVLYVFVSVALGLYVGPLVDKYGPRWLILSGTVCLVVSAILLSISTGKSQRWCSLTCSLILTSLADYSYILAAFGILGGLASTLLFTPAIVVVGHFFKVRRGFAIGIATTAGGISGIFFPVLLQSLYVKVGFSWAIRTLGIVCLVAAVISNFLIRSRTIITPASFADVTADAINPHPGNIIQLFRSNKAYALTTAAVFLLEFALFIPFTYISAYSLSHGHSHRFSFIVTLVLNAASVVGHVLPPWCADAKNKRFGGIGPFNTIMVSCAVSVVAFFVLWLPAGRTPAGIILFVLVFGFASGGAKALVPVSVGQLCGTKDYGRYYGICHALVSTTVPLVGITVAGQIADVWDRPFWALILISGVFLLGALGVFMRAKIEVLGSSSSPGWRWSHGLRGVF